MERRKINFMEECRIVYRLIEGEAYKSIARDYNVTHHTVAKIQRAWPLFFWNKYRVRRLFWIQRYKKLPGKF